MFWATGTGEASRNARIADLLNMIGVPLRTHDLARRYPSPKGMVEALETRGFCIGQPHESGNIHFEHYW